MGTRADFYIGKSVDMRWIGSIAGDGAPYGINKAVLESKTEVSLKGFFLKSRHLAQTGVALAVAK